MDNKELRILYVDDDVENQQDLKDVLSGKQINELSVTLDCESDFESSVDKSREYHIVILDLYKGAATNGGEDVGRVTLDKVKNKFFVPVIFYSGNINGVKNQRSQVVGVASKGDDIEALVNEIKRLSQQNLPFLKNNVHAYIEEEFKKYFWEVIHKENNKFTPDAEDFSLGYMLLRNFANSLSKENIKNIIGDDTINSEKVHPMEFYIYPTDSTKEFENGEILRKKENGDFYVILTPSCDFVCGKGRKRKAEHVLLVKAVLLENTSEYKDYIKIYDLQKGIDDINKSLSQGNMAEQEKLNKEKEIQTKEQTKTNKIASFKQFLNSGKNDRCFFLPGTPFIKNRVVDFQDIEIVDYSSLNEKFDRIAKLDSPFAQSMIASYIRYYNRIGFPDIDTEYVINHLDVK